MVHRRKTIEPWLSPLIVFNQLVQPRNKKASSSKNSGTSRSKSSDKSSQSNADLFTRKHTESMSHAEPLAKDLTSSWAEISVIENEQNSVDFEASTYVEVDVTAFPDVAHSLSMSDSGKSRDVACSSSNDIFSNSSGYSNSIEKPFCFLLKKSKSFSAHNPSTQKPRIRTIKSPSFKERKSTISSCDGDCNEGRLMMGALTASAIVHD